MHSTEPEGPDKQLHQRFLRVGLLSVHMYDHGLGERAWRWVRMSID